MPWTYQQSTGALTNPYGAQIGIGYSGNGPDLNNQASQEIEGHGPIPRGEWIIGRFFDDPGGKGPIVCRLEPRVGTETFGRSGFMIHGDNPLANHSASDGCIVLGHLQREGIMSSNDRLLNVIA